MFNNCNEDPGQVEVNVINCKARSNKTKSLTQPSPSSVELAPNPTNGSVIITFTTTSDEEVSITVTDLSGKEQLTIQNGFLSKGTHRMEADLSKLTAGTYIVRIVSASENQTLRVVKTEK